ncbi:OmpA family protein [Pseudoroseicyclus sp. CLL3-39]|uniref:OmpA family protein n=2 Tax=Pseudoroseicyclus tamaricis TaxID=2705421 RepID=A0A6B2K4U1_9RHOB|nr:OmpA family protein [Pseudoroseicyclus tamaricis]
MTAERLEEAGSYAVPVGPAEAGEVPLRIEEGEVRAQAWRVGAELSTLELLAPLRAQLEAEGFAPLLDCETEACGGFDFRRAVELLPAPDFWFDLGDFRAVTAERLLPGGEREVIFLLASGTGRAAYAHVVRIGPAAGPLSATGAPAAVAERPAAAPPGDFAGELEGTGRVILTDLSFETGSAQLGPGPYASLQALARYLSDRPERRVALVGHTDTEGGLEANITLSRRRAGSVLERLAGRYGIPRAQMAAEGMGYLAPVASNLTEAGREENRRVEVVLTSGG